MESTLVIKVQYEDTLRRFNARVIDDENLDLDMPRLKAKIFSLFDIPSDTDLTLTYIDEDGDIVTLVDDDDLRDVMKQQLKFLKIIVYTEKSVRSYARSSGASTPLRSPRVQPPIPNFNAVVAEAMKSVPEALHETLTRMSEDFLSKATSSSPSIADLIEQLAKMGLGRPSSHPIPPAAPAASPSTAADGMNEATMQPGKAAIVSSSKTDLPAEFVAAARSIVRPPSSVQLPIDLNALPPVNSSPLSDMKEPHKDVKNASQGQVGGKADASSSSTGTAETAAVPQRNSSPIGGFTGSSAACPFSGLPLPSSMLPHMHRNKRGCKPTDVAGGVFHRGIRCDGCGVHPITGPRYKSLVKDDYDLCSICFAEIGREGDYVRIDRPISYRHVRDGIKTPGFQQQPWVPPMPGKIFPILQHCPGVKRGHPKLDSRFVSDVTVMDGTVMAPSTPFTKIWRMRNNGNFVWVSGTRLVWIGGDNFSNQESLEIQIPPEGVPVNEELDVALDFVAPPSPGRYISYWRMASPSGHKFGQRVWVLIQVDGSVNESSDKGAINLNLPPEAIGNILHEMNSSQAAGGVDDSSAEATTSLAEQQGEKDLEQNFPINDALLVGNAASASAPPETSSSISYPTVDPYDGVEVVASVPAPAPASPGEVAVQPSETNGAEVDAVEQNLLKELAQMGFKQVDLNKQVLRMNSYDLQQSVDDLCGVFDWDPILEELQEMGFCDREMNKRLLKKNDGRISRVVADLLTGEKA